MAYCSNINKGGYDRISLIINRWFNLFVSLVVVILCLPLYILIGLAVKLTDRGPILHKCQRLGINKVPFYMYKFRTLAVGADQIIGADLLDQRSNIHQNLITSIGYFLRETRLDELPQFINVILGDMDMIGPRPVRPAVYEKFCQGIKGYDNRFKVKPGVIGSSQLFTPHGTPKRIRAYIDNLFLKKKQVLIWDVSLVFYSLFILAIKLCKKVSFYFYDYIIKVKVLRLYKRERRVYERSNLKDAYVYVDGNDEQKGRLVDINTEAILMSSNNDIDPKNNDFLLRLEVLKSLGASKNKRHIAYCKGDIYKKIEIDGNPCKFRYIIKFKSTSRFNNYMIHQYFLSESIVGR